MICLESTFAKKFEVITQDFFRERLHLYQKVPTMDLVIVTLLGSHHKKGQKEKVFLKFCFNCSVIIFKKTTRHKYLSNKLSSGVFTQKRVSHKICLVYNFTVILKISVTNIFIKRDQSNILSLMTRKLELILKFFYVKY